MLDVILQSVICFLAVYGLIQMGFNIYDAFMDMRHDKQKNMYIIITVKNQQDTIERIVRYLVWKNLNNEYGGILPNILIVDMGSTDDTPEILSRLHREYNFIQVTDRQNYIKFMEKIIR